MSSPENPYPQQGQPGPGQPPPPPSWPGAMPPPADGYGGPPGPPPVVSRPGTVVGAVVFWVLAGLVLLGSGALTLSTARTPEGRRVLADALAESNVQVSDATLETVLSATGWGTIVVGVLVVLLGLLLLGGANWARILVTVVGAIGSLTLYPLLFALVAVVLQFLPPSNAWFRSQAAARRTA